jgi:FAD/FMN-containing dehydrogenase
MSGVRGMGMNGDESVSVGPGVNLRDLADFLQSKGRALKTIPAFGNITIGGAIGTAAHGSSIKHTSSISEQAIAFLIVDGLGRVRQIWKEEDLRAFRVHLGLLGIILEVLCLLRLGLRVNYGVFKPLGFRDLELFFFGIPFRHPKL